MLQTIEVTSRKDEDVLQSVKVAGFDARASSQAVQAIRKWAFVGSVKLCLVNRHEPAARTVTKLNGDRYQAQSRGATEDSLAGSFRLPPGLPEVLFITGKAWGGLPQPDEIRLINGWWQTAIAIFLQGEAEGELFGEKGNPPVLRVIMDRISGVRVDGSSITCASFAEKVSHVLGRHHVQALVNKVAHSALTSGLSTEDLDVRDLTPDRLVERCLSRRQNSPGLRGQLPSTNAAAHFASKGNYDNYLASPVWQAFAADFKKLAAGSCELCGNGSMLGKKNQMTVHYEVHHLVYEDVDGKVLGRERDVPYALAKVCDRCHNLLESLKYVHWDSYETLCRMCGC